MTYIRYAIKVIVYFLCVKIIYINIIMLNIVKCLLIIIFMYNYL